MRYFKIYGVACVALIVIFLSVGEKIRAQSGEKEISARPDMTFAFYWNDELVCYPRFISDKSRFYEVIPDSIDSILDEAETNSDNTFVPFADDLLDSHISDRRGDTVAIVWANGISRAIIEEIGAMYEVCQVQYLCRLRPHDPVPGSSYRDPSFVVLRRDIGQTRKPIPFEEIEYSPSALDSLTGAFVTYANHNANNIKYFWMDLELSRARDEMEEKRIIKRYEEHWDEIPYFPESPVLKIYRPENEILSDSAWALVTEKRDYGKVLLFRALISGDSVGISDSIYVTHKVMNAEVTLDLTADFDGDGRPEYLLNKGVCEELFEDIKGSYVKLMESEVRACP